jgi:type II secretory pathway component PulC
MFCLRQTECFLFPSKPDDAPPEVPPVKDSWEMFKLQGIFFSGTNSTAIINNRTLKIGEEIDGVKILSISPKTVIVDYRGEKKTLSLP